MVAAVPKSLRLVSGRVAEQAGGTLRRRFGNTNVVKRCEAKSRWS